MPIMKVFLAAISLLVAGRASAQCYEFSASWCPPCRAFAPTIDKCIADGLPIIKLDFDKERNFAGQCGVNCIPALVAVKDGQVVDRTTGAVSEARIRQLCDKATTTKSLAYWTVPAQPVVIVQQPVAYPVQPMAVPVYCPLTSLFWGAPAYTYQVRYVPVAPAPQPAWPTLP